MSSILPVVATLAATATFQAGAALAKGMFPLVGPEGAAALRLGFGALILLALVRPWGRLRRGDPILPIIGLGLSMAVVILMFFQAMERLPLGIAIALQFLGPLGVAVFGSRRVLDFLWAGLAALGVTLLVGLHEGGGSLDPGGVMWGLGAGVGWACYVLCGRAARRADTPSVAAVAASIAAVIALPFGIAGAGTALLSPEVLPLAIGVGFLSIAIPFSLELFAMRHLPAKTFSVLLSLEPAFGVLFGFLFLHELLTTTELVGIASVVVAAAGSARYARPMPEAPTPT